MKKNEDAPEEIKKIKRLIRAVITDDLIEFMFVRKVIHRNTMAFFQRYAAT